MCKAMSYVQGVSVFASAYSLVAFSANRCETLYRELGSRKTISKREAKLIILFIWLFGLLLMSPWIMVFEVVSTGEHDVLQCLEDWPSEAHGKYFYLFCNLIGCYAFPLSLVAVFNVFVWCKVSRRKMPHNSTSIITGIARIHRKTRKNARRSLSVVTFAFLLCWLPLHVVVSRLELFPEIPIENGEAQILSIIIPFAQLLGSLNSSINPIIYAFLNPSFRKACASVFCSLPEYVQDVGGASNRGILFLRNYNVQGEAFV